MNGSALFVAVFLACLVEAVEATTIVMAAGTARDWGSALRGTFAGFIVLAVIIAAIGPAISTLPMGALRLFVGGLLLVFGLQWLRKAILRSSGYKGLHDEEAIFNREVAAARKAAGQVRFGVADWYAFTLSFKGVLLEGLEVAFIVLTFGTIQRQIPLASLAALLAVTLVVIAGFALRKPLARVPENSMKFTVGIMLTSFGIFWGAEGAGANWPQQDLALPFIVAFIFILSRLLILALRRRLRRQNPVTVVSPAQATPAQATPAQSTQEDDILESRTFRDGMKAFGFFWFDFLIGDDWRGTVGILFAFLLTFLLGRSGAASWWILPLAIAAVLPYSLLRATQQREPLSL